MNTLAPYEVVLIKGAWLPVESWRPLQDELQAHGVSTVAPDLPSSELGLTFDDDTREVESAVSGRASLFLAAHSRGVEVLPRLLGRLERGQAIGALIISSGGPRIYDIRDDSGEPVCRYSEEFAQGVSMDGTGLTVLSKETANNFLLYDVADKALKNRMLRGLQKQRSAEASATQTPSPAISKDFPITVANGRYDKVLNLAYAHQVFVRWLGQEPQQLSWGHVPQLSHPTRLAELIIKLAEESAKVN